MKTIKIKYKNTIIEKQRFSIEQYNGKSWYFLLILKEQRRHLKNIAFFNEKDLIFFKYICKMCLEILSDLIS